MKSLVLSGLVLAAASVVPAHAQPAAPPFTAAQTEQGADLYRKNCTQCHGADLGAGEFGPSLKGAGFKRQWGGKSVAALFDLMVMTMPPGQAGLMTPEEYAAILALVLQTNGGAPGAAPLPADPKALGGFTVPQ